MNSANDHRGFDPSEQGQAGVVFQMPLQLQRQMRPGAEEIVAGVLSQNESLRRGVEKDSGDAGAHVELQVPKRWRQVDRQRDFLTAIVQIDHVDVQSALEKTVTQQVEILDVARALRHYGTVGRGE